MRFTPSSNRRKYSSGIQNSGAVLSLSGIFDTAERYRRGLEQEDVDAFGEVFEDIPEADLRGLVPKGTLDLSGDFRKRFI